jgi:TetR/AcrR family transcriptional regulator, transcriptional repressor for nem operon
MPLAKQFDADDVLRKAMEAFWWRGYEATSVQDLVDCTGVNRASLYATYGGKRALFLSALRLYDLRMRAEPLAELEARLPPRQAIRRLFDGFVAQAAAPGARRGCLVVNTALELAAHDADVARIVARSQAGIEAFFARMVKKGKAIGDIGPHVKEAETARGLRASLIGLVVLTRSRPEQALLASIAREAVRRLD